MAIPSSMMNVPGNRLGDATVNMDIQALDTIKQQARTDKDGALRQVAQQFEAMFMQMIMKSMRQATKQLNEDSFLNTQYTEHFQEMHDDQLVQEMGKGGGMGLAGMIYDQLSDTGRQPTGNNVPDILPFDRDGRPELPLRPPSRGTPSGGGELTTEAPAVGPAAAAEKQSVFSSPEDFVRSLWPMARDAARQLGADARYLLAQAALETGWGQHVIGGEQGSSHNLFNIKADHRWEGPKARVMTREYLQGRPVQVAADFRQYDSFADSFADYRHFLQNSPRYQSALNQAESGPAYVAALQQAGYATDPRYAEKIERIAESPHLNAVVSAQELSGD